MIHVRTWFCKKIENKIDAFYNRKHNFDHFFLK